MKRPTLALAIALSLAPLALHGEALDEDPFLEEDLEASASAEIADPLEKVNRKIFAFNDFAYKKVFRPFAKGYSKIMPDPAEKGLSNAFDNLAYPSRLVGNLLQGKFKGAGKETGRFLVNTTVGLGGLMDPAKEIKSLQTPKEDLGQSFGKWGLGHGFYVVLPFMGPTSLRDFVGNVGDSAANPIPQPWSQVDDDSDRALLQATEVVNSLPNILDLYDSLTRSAIDPYTAARNAYAQLRARQTSE